MFRTIQGEGRFSGYPAFFIRLFGCNLQCPLCDTDYTSNEEVYRPYKLAEKVKEANLPLVVITGGEPLRQNIMPFIWSVPDKYIVQIETNGTIFDRAVAISRAHITISPKTTKIASEWYESPYVIGNCTWKYVLDHKSVSITDGLPNDVLGMGLPPARPPEWVSTESIFLQPMHTNDPKYNEKCLKAVIESATKYGYRISLQTHKIMDLP